MNAHGILNWCENMNNISIQLMHQTGFDLIDNVLHCSVTNRDMLMLMAVVTHCKTIAPPSGLANLAIFLLKLNYYEQP